jgi:hypothetical protein
MIVNASFAVIATNDDQSLLDAIAAQLHAQPAQRREVVR